LQKRRSIFHTPLDDLESFLWFLIWCIVHLSKDIEGARDKNPGIDPMLDAWSGNVMANRTRFWTVEDAWKDAVFGSVIKEWLNTLRRMREETRDLTEFLSGIKVEKDPDSDWMKSCNLLESCCKTAYKEILQSGFEHLKGVWHYSDWEAVVTANVPTTTFHF
jgi:hypothetical protein